ncbi:ABC transporter ATP-binding protein [Cryobacterium sp. Hb1]|uniref:ABC transporter ATP-binding protein n=1 Tax=Cryobacterium sp. Hb1 TaxID=1259147 RepID=UPI0018E0653B|nr:ABC transporter ATP-binding protein [Cryobacterium sp. Hb1]
MTIPLLEAHNLYKTFPPLTKRDQPAPVLQGISMAVMPGEMVSIVGPSGSGKSTLLYCLSGLESPTSGALSVMGHDLSKQTRSQVATLRRDHIGFVFQSFNLIPSLSARQNVSLPARLAKHGPNPPGVERALSDVGMSAHARKRPGELSGGQQQRVAIARVLASQPDIVFADEPTGSLDTANGAEALRLLRQTTTPTSALVMVTHDLEAAALADRVLVMRDGTIHRELVSPTADAVLDAVRNARTVGER